MSQLAKIASNVVLSVCSICVSLGLLEGLARIVWHLQQPKHARMSPVGAGKSGFYWNSVGEFENIVVYNVMGFHDFERNLERKPGIKRVAVIGDSFVEAMQVPREQIFFNILNGRLASSRGYEFLGFGRSGYGPMSYLETYLEFVAQFNPDLVIVILFLLNDFENDYPPYAAKRSYAPRLKWAADGKLESFGPYVSGSVNHVEEPLLRRFLQGLMPSTFALANQAAERSVNAYKILTLIGATKKDEHRLKMSTHLDVLQDPLPKYVDESIKFACENLVKMQREVLSKGSRFAVMLLPGREQVYFDSFKKDLENYPESARLSFNERSPNDKFVEHCGRQLLIRDVLPIFKQKKEDLYFRLDGHLNQSGHRALAESVEDFLKTIDQG